jgi:hypothetical protein
MTGGGGTIESGKREYPIASFPRKKRSRDSGAFEMEKWCPSCRQYLSADAFRFMPARGCLDSWCRACHAEACRRWREQNPEHVGASNGARRLGERERECVDCGSSFVYLSTLAVRCPDCRRERKNKQRRDLRRAA